MCAGAHGPSADARVTREHGKGDLWIYSQRDMAPSRRMTSPSSLAPATRWPGARRSTTPRGGRPAGPGKASSAPACESASAFDPSGVKWRAGSQLTRRVTLTFDQGKELADHRALSPWKRWRVKRCLGSAALRLPEFQLRRQPRQIHLTRAHPDTAKDIRSKITQLRC